MDVCFNVNNSCVEEAKCNIKLDKSNDTDDLLLEPLNYTFPELNNQLLKSSKSINRDTNNQLSDDEMDYSNDCHRLKFKWMPKGRNHGNLQVTKNLETDYKVAKSWIIVADHNFTCYRINLVTIHSHVKMLRW